MGFIYNEKIFKNYDRNEIVSEGDIPSERDSQSCSVVNDICYVFGGQVKI